MQSEKVEWFCLISGIWKISEKDGWLFATLSFTNSTLDLLFMSKKIRAASQLYLYNKPFFLCTVLLEGIIKFSCWPNSLILEFEAFWLIATSENNIFHYILACWPIVFYKLHAWRKIRAIIISWFMNSKLLRLESKRNKKGISFCQKNINDKSALVFFILCTAPNTTSIPCSQAYSGSACQKQRNKNNKNSSNKFRSPCEC